MVRSRAALLSMIKEGRTVSRLIGFGGLNEWRWVITDTAEPVHGSPLKAALANGELRVIQTDICGEPMQYGPA
jgi:hypothetical protein